MSKKFTLSSTDFSRLNINNKVYFNPPLCPYYRYSWERCKDLQRRKMIHHVFCLGSVAANKLTDQSLPLKIYHDSDIPYSQSDSIAKVIEEYLLFYTGNRSRTPATTRQFLHVYCYLSTWLHFWPYFFFYCPCENYLRYFRGSTDTPPYTTVHTFSAKKFFLV